MVLTKILYRPPHPSESKSEFGREKSEYGYRSNLRMRMKRPSQTRNCTVQKSNELTPRTFVNLLQCLPDSNFRDFARDSTPQTVLIHLKKAPDGMIVPKCEFGNHEEQKFLRLGPD